MEDKEILVNQLYGALVGNKLIPEWAQEDSEIYAAAFKEVLQDYLVEKKN